MKGTKVEKAYDGSMMLLNSFMVENLLFLVDLEAMALDLFVGDDVGEDVVLERVGFPVFHRVGLPLFDLFLSHCYKFD